jgi:hypothetical protein
VPLFHLVVHAASKSLDLSVYGVEAVINFSEVFVDSGEFAGAKAGEGIDQTVTWVKPSWIRFSRRSKRSSKSLSFICWKYTTARSVVERHGS